MQKFVELGKVARPHGYKGALVVWSSTGKESALAYVDSIWIGKTPETLNAYQVTSRAWMPKGWKLTLDSIESEDQVRTLQRQHVYAERDHLEPLEDGQYYFSDIIGCEVLRTENDEPVGVLASIDSSTHPNPLCRQDLWNVKKPKGQIISVPSTGNYIHKISIQDKKVWITDWDLLQ